MLLLLPLAHATPELPLRREVVEQTPEDTWVVRDARDELVTTTELVDLAGDAERRDRLAEEKLRVTRRGRRHFWVGVALTGVGAGVAATGLPIGGRPASNTTLVAGVTLAALGPPWAAAGKLSGPVSVRALEAPAYWWTEAEMDALLAGLASTP